MITFPEPDPALDGDRLRTALASANLPALLMVLHQLTGDPAWLESPYRPARRFGMDPNDSGGLPADVQAVVREEAHHAITAWSRGAPVRVPRPRGELLTRMTGLAVSEDVPPEYEPMTVAQMGFAGEPDAPAPPRSEAAGFFVVVIGAGLGGLMAALRLTQAGIGFVVLEKSGHPGGVWWDNRYPGAGVDTPSYLYSFSFFPRNWPTYFARRDDVMDYVDEFVDHYDLRASIRCHTEVTGAEYDEHRQKWTVRATTSDRAHVTLTADAVITAVGIFSRPKEPDVPGAEEFEGPAFHSARWPADLDVTGRDVALVGTGASAMQILPKIAGTARSVTVYQRSPAWVTPVSNYFDPVPDDVHWLVDHVPYYHAWYRFTLGWTFNDKLHPAVQKDPDWTDPEHTISATNDRHRRAFTRYLLEQLDGRPDLVAKCLPDYPPWGKRMLIDNGWYAALRRDDVELVAEGVAELTPRGVVSASGRERPADVVVFCTGFESTRYLLPMTITGRDGTDLRESWDDDDARAYLGITAPGFPNLFFVYGPNTSGSGGSFLAWSESQVGYIVQLLTAMVDKQIGALEPRRDRHDEYNRRVDEAHAKMIWTHPRFTTYYRNSRGRVVVLVPWRVVDYWRMLRHADLDDYVTEPVGERPEREER